jgi:hypothetical protein
MLFTIGTLKVTAFEGNILFEKILLQVGPQLSPQPGGILDSHNHLPTVVARLVVGQAFAAAQQS